MKIGDTLSGFGGASPIPSKQIQHSQNFIQQTSDLFGTLNEKKMTSMGQSMNEKWIDESSSDSFRLIRRNEDVRSERAIARSMRNEELVPRQTRIQQRQNSTLADSVSPIGEKTPKEGILFTNLKEKKK